MIRNDPDLVDWLWEQREWSPWARSVALYYDAHGFITEAQHAAAVRMRKRSEKDKEEESERVQQTAWG